jgi:hypothetical protein
MTIGVGRHQIRRRGSLVEKTRHIVARMLISISVDEAHVEMLINCQTAKHMWSRLAIVHEQSSRENVHLLQGEFFSYKM